MIGLGAIIHLNIQITSVNIQLPVWLYLLIEINPLVSIL